jgi:anti-sigma factor RsiW
MKCQEFQDQLYEYLDGVLDGDVQASVREHLRQCKACRCTLEREKAVSQFIRHSLDRETAGLSLRSGTLRNVLQQLDPKPIAPNVLILAWRWLFSSPFHVAGMGAAALGALFLFFNVQPHRQPSENSSSSPVAEMPQNTRVIDVPIQTETHVFHREHDTVMDAITPRVALGQASFPEPEHPTESL